MRPPAGALALDVAGEQLFLLPQRALWWPARQLLAVADVHVGKAASFRALGMPVPSGTTAQNLVSLDEALAATGARRLLFLGDLLHARAGRTAATMRALQAWCERHVNLELRLVRGNHDSRAGDPPPESGIAVVDEPWREGQFLFCHHPHGHERQPGEIVIAGHVHPVYALAHKRERMRLPCFLLRNACLILPAFGAFTGGYAIEQEEDDRIFLVTPDAVHALPPARASAQERT